MDDLDSFASYCIVCDRAIAPVKEKEKVAETKTGKKKVAGGTIRVKNADGTVMIRTANGTKTTRPALRRNTSSANRLAVAAANNNAAAAKLQPLTRSKTTGTDLGDHGGDKSEAGPSSASNSPESQAIKTPITPASSDAYQSAIYCSRLCAQHDTDRSNDLARRVSFDIGAHGHGLHLVTSGLPITLAGSNKSPYGPASPICISESDTSSSADPSSAEPAACSVPNGMGLFQYGREGPDTAWNEVNRQRRSSMHPAVRPVLMAREPSQASQWSVTQSSDSLNSLWTDQEPSLARSTSGSGKVRIMPFVGVDGSHSSTERERGIPVRPVPRSALSQTSLAASPRPTTLPAEFGSAPDHTFDLWHSFNNSFAKRDATGTSSRGFAYPAGATPTTSPPLSTSRRPSYSLSRTSGTIRANKSHTNVTWDSFGQEELRAKQRRASMKAPAPQSPSPGLVEHEHGQTPKQSIEIGKNGCEIKYYLPQSLGRMGMSPVARPLNARRSSHRSVSSLRSDSSVSDTDEAHHHASGNAQPAHPGALQIPRPQLSSSHSSSARTPTRMLPPSALPLRIGSGTPKETIMMPDLAALRVGSGSCAPYLQTTPVLGSSPHVSGTVTPSCSAPKSNFNWSEFERKGGKTYEVPDGLKAHAGKTGLFYFQ